MSADWDFGKLDENAKKRMREYNFKKSVESGEYDELLKRLELLEQNRIIYRNNILILIQNIAIIGAAVYGAVYICTH